MEDMFSYDSNLSYGFSYYGIFDGHGGAEVSIYLKNNMRNIILQRINELFIHNDDEKHIDVSQLLYDSFKQIVNDIPYKLAINTGSTAVVILKRNKQIWVANVGDSRAIMNNGHDIVELTKDHKPTDEKEYKRIISLGGNVSKAYHGDVYRVNGILAVSRAIGDFSLAPHVSWKPDVKLFSIEDSNHYILMATDGVWDVLSNNNVINIINNKIMNEEWKDIGRTIISTSRIQGSGDNIVCMFIIL
jgi:protein phosphatase 1L